MAAVRAVQPPPTPQTTLRSKESNPNRTASMYLVDFPYNDWPFTGAGGRRTQEAATNEE